MTDMSESHPSTYPEMRESFLARASGSRPRHMSGMKLSSECARSRRVGAALEIGDDRLGLDLLLDIDRHRLDGEVVAQSLPRQTSCGSRSVLRGQRTVCGALSSLATKPSSSAVGICRRFASLWLSDSIPLPGWGLSLLAFGARAKPSLSILK